MHWRPGNARAVRVLGVRGGIRRAERALDSGRGRPARLPHNRRDRVDGRATPRALATLQAMDAPILACAPFGAELVCAREGRNAMAVTASALSESYYPADQSEPVLDTTVG